MKISRPLAFALTGWVVGAIATISVGLYWPTIFPAILENQHYYGIGPSLLIIIGLAMVIASPAALVGGLIGGRIPREGGQTEQYIMAAIMGIIFALPFACMGMWFFTGW
ncbi:MAG: hypothetical protein NTW69_12035 [Chloroflexi bacterium]|jgi:hypothetical protein|nr:hypothetical protein [Chloroflexota bacterium]